MYPIDFFYRQVLKDGDRIAAEFGNESITYRVLKNKSDALAAAFQDTDPTPGSRVGICCFNHIDHLIAWLAVLAAGKVWVPLYPKNREAEICQSIEFTEMSIVVVDDESQHLVKDSEAKILIANAEEGQASLAELIRKYEGKKPVFHFFPLHETQAIKFTGGTTGKPKGVMQPYRAWNTNIITQIMAWDMQEGDRYLAAAPITHGTSTYILPTLATGGTIVILDQPRPKETLHHLLTNNITTTFLPPTVLYLMMQIPEAKEGNYERLRNLVYGSAPMRPEAIADAQQIFGPCIASNYGQTEAPQIATMITAQDLLRPEKRASVGRETILSKVGIIDESGNLLPAGSNGEIVLRGDLLMTGYWRQPDKTSETIVDGWLRTGDLGFVDDEGFLFIIGRTKDVIITGGFNVYPIDVEPAIAGHESVVDCAVFGVPDEKWGEAVHAAVELRDGIHVEPNEIITFIKEKLGSVKTPKSLVVYDRLPRNAYGKLQKQTLIDDYIKSTKADKQKDT